MEWGIAELLGVPEGPEQIWRGPRLARVGLEEADVGLCPVNQVMMIACREPRTQGMQLTPAVNKDGRTCYSYYLLRYIDVLGVRKS